MSSTYKWIVLIDTPSIKKYVFGTDTLREIRGASALLDDLNRNKTSEIVKKLEDLSHRAKVDCIYANGGTAQFIVEGDGLNQKAIENFLLDHLIKTYQRETCFGARVVYGIHQFDQDNEKKRTKIPR